MSSPVDFCLAVCRRRWTAPASPWPRSSPSRRGAGEPRPRLSLSPLRQSLNSHTWLNQPAMASTVRMSGVSFAARAQADLFLPPFAAAARRTWANSGPCIMHQLLPATGAVWHCRPLLQIAAHFVAIPLLPRPSGHRTLLASSQIIHAHGHHRLDSISRTSRSDPEALASVAVTVSPSTCACSLMANTSST